MHPIHNGHKRRRLELLFIGIFTCIVVVVMIVATVWLLINQGFTSNTLAIVSIIVVIVLGLPSLTFTYFQWRHPMQDTTRQNTNHLVSAPLNNLHDQSILPAADAISQATRPPMTRSTDALPPIWNVPYQRNPIFTDREVELERLYKALKETKHEVSKQPQAVSGLGGIGKTQIAIEYAYRFHKDYQAVFWIRANSLETFISDFINVADLLNLPESKMENQKIVINAVNRWLQDHIDWLLILDDVENWMMIREFIPSTSNGDIILTTRAHTTGVTALLLGVDKMTTEEGALLLLRRTHALGQDAQLINASVADLAIAKEIAHTIEGIPLALDQAGAYIEEMGCALSDYLKLYQKHRLEILSFRGEVAFDHPESVAATWLLSFQRIERINPVAADLLRLCTFLYPEAIPEEIISEGSATLSSHLGPVANDPLLLNMTIKELLKYSLLHRNSETKTLTMHRLVQAVIKDYMDIDMQHLWAECAVRVMNIAFPDKQFETWQRCQSYLPHIEVCANIIDKLRIVSTEAAQLLDKAGSYLQRRGQYTQADSFLTKALNIREKALGPEHPDTILNLALLYYNQGKYELAEPLYQQALGIYEQTLGSNHPKWQLFLTTWHGSIMVGASTIKLNLSILERCRFAKGR